RNEKGEPALAVRDERLEAQFLEEVIGQHPHFEEQRSGDLPYFYLHKDRFLEEDWYLDACAAWRESGIVLQGFTSIRGPRRSTYKAAVSVRVAAQADWFQTRIEARFGPARASLKDLRQAVLRRSRYVLLDDGTEGVLPGEWIDRLAAFFRLSEVKAELLRTRKIHYDALRELCPPEALDESARAEMDRYRTALAPYATLPEVPLPPGLKATLRHYQWQGLNWLALLDRLGFGGCLADDMGLGKTVQVLAFLLHLRAKGTGRASLLVVPASLLFNWAAEIGKFAPSLRYLQHHGSGRSRDTGGFGGCELVITTYGTLVADSALLRRYPWHYVFLDEAQEIKNPGGLRYAAAAALPSDNRIVITGTPVENYSFDLYSQLSFACPGLFPSRQEFRDLYAIPIDKFKNSKRAAELREKVRPFILRRTKNEVAPELPDKTEIVLRCPMGDAQAAVYEAAAQEIRDYLAGIRPEEWERSRLHVLKSLTRLRQICNAPALLPESPAGAGSAKIERLLEQVRNKAPRHKILVFSQFVSMLDLIGTALQEAGIRYERLTGSTRDRGGAVERFQSDEAVRVFLISLKAGGTGLNLTRADYVYLVDPWWNPAVEQQAIDRSHRIGQEARVVAARLITPGTVEEKILLLQQSKKELSEGLIRPGTGLLQGLSREEWVGLI
ncbi:MAG TPA: DEAD/DEAH box helicase, partial [Chitinophagaceae bacterium]|nr:DEAD/DEAH box helicase [Chitinophagaceae bacterium]